MCRVVFGLNHEVLLLEIEELDLIWSQEDFDKLPHHGVGGYQLSHVEYFVHCLFGFLNELEFLPTPLAQVLLENGEGVGY